MMLAKLRRHEFMHNAAPAIRALKAADACETGRLIAALETEGLAIGPQAPLDRSTLIEQLARRGFIEFHLADDRGVVVIPCREDFSMHALPLVETGCWKLSRFAYMHVEHGELVIRHPQADCLLKVNDPAARALLLEFDRPTDVAELAATGRAGEQIFFLCGLFARAGLILPCDKSGASPEDRDSAPRQWGFHELLFHSLSRLGRTEKPIGATFAFRGKIAPQPALKAVPEAWTETVVDLPPPNLEALVAGDLPLTAAIEGRRSIRQHSIVPPSKFQLGEFLFRTARVRSRYRNDHGEFTSRPYPGGGACYEMEVYVTVDGCVGIPRGFYYYDPLRHRLCLISPPDDRIESLLGDACQATGGQGRPQILLTMASRFNRFNWKYSSMSYATQLKNVGVIYQTMYLVATAMNLAGCALGLGNTDRFCELTGLDYLEEGSIGEFMLGRPL